MHRFYVSLLCWGLAASSLVGCGIGTVQEYHPHASHAFEVPFRTMAEHDSIRRGQSPPYTYFVEIPPEATTTGSALLYYGSNHTNDPDHPMIADIQARWDAFAPTVAVTENRPGFYLGTLRHAVRRHAEFGAVLDLARRDEVPIYTLEPTWADEVTDVKAAFPVEEVTLFFTLRVFLSERGQGRSPEDIDALAAHLLRKRGSRPGLEGSLPDLAALDALWAERFAHLGPWRTLPPEAVHPSPSPTRLQAIANRVNEARDRHAARVLLDLLAQGERVFAVSGASHVIKQEPVILAAAVTSE